MWVGVISDQNLLDCSPNCHPGPVCAATGSLPAGHGNVRGAISFPRMSSFRSCKHNLFALPRLFLCVRSWGGQGDVVLVLLFYRARVAVGHVVSSNSFVGGRRGCCFLFHCELSSELILSTHSCSGQVVFVFWGVCCCWGRGVPSDFRFYHGSCS